MGGSMTKMMQPEELTDFKKLPQNTLIDELAIPERPENRVPTDKRFLISYGVLLILIIPFLIYSLAYSDLDRFHERIDNCGNICGKVNAKYDEWSCTGQDFRDKTVLKVDSENWNHDDNLLIKKECVTYCPDGYQRVVFGGFCMKKYESLSSDFSYRYPRDIHSENDEDIDTEPETNIKKMAWRIVLACLMSVGVSLGTLYLFRWATAAMVWSLLVGFLVLLTFGTIACWVSYSRADQYFKSITLFFSIFATIVLLVIICMIAFLAKKIKLVIAMLKEAMKAAFAMPQLMFIPILTFIASAIILVLFIYAMVYLSTSGILTELAPGYLAYTKNFVMYFTNIFITVMTIWSLQFLVGIQYMVIAGAVAKWYFAKNKNHLDSPILTSASNTFKFHLGTIALGSILITIIMIIRSIISSAIKNRYLKFIVDCCLSGIEQFLKFLSKNAYIMTAMHGKPFYKSGRRAAKILYQNAVNVASINFIGDFILGLAKLSIVAVSLVFAYVIMESDGDKGLYQYVVYMIVFVISLIIASIFFSIFETVIDTIFLCFCEDTLLNDGMVRPYAMSTDLMQFIDNAKKVFGDNKK